MTVRNLRVDLVLQGGYQKKQRLEEGLKKQQELIKWCEHLVIVTPVWWLGVPALLKGYLDRVLLPGFAFNYKKGSVFPVRHLKGKSARVIYTQGSPRWISRWLLSNSFWKGIKWGVLRFVGFGPIKRTVFGRASNASDNRKRKWLNKVYKLGNKGK